MAGATAPKFTQKPSLKQDGGNIVFSCEIEAEPKPEVTWFLGDNPLSEGDRLIKSVTQIEGTKKYSLNLTVKDVVASDSGTYKVEAKNKLGQMAGNINLNLQCKDTEVLPLFSNKWILYICICRPTTVFSVAFYLVRHIFFFFQPLQFFFPPAHLQIISSFHWF